MNAVVPLPTIENAKLPASYETQDALIDAYARFATRYEKGNPPPALPGVYAFWLSEGRCLYVGESKNLKQRLQSHPRKKDYPFEWIDWLVCQNHKQAEVWLIEHCMPIRNGVTREHEYLQDLAHRKPPHGLLGESFDAMFNRIFNGFGK